MNNTTSVQNIESKYPPNQSVPKKINLAVFFIIFITGLLTGGSGSYFLLKGTDQNRYSIRSVTPAVTLNPLPSTQILPSNIAVPAVSYTPAISTPVDNINALPTNEPKAKEFVPVKDMWSKGRKRYSNPKINFTFEYPSILLMEEYDNNPVNEMNHSFEIRFRSPELDNSISLNITDEEYMDYLIHIELYKFDNPNHRSLYDFIAEQNKVVSSAGIIVGNFNDFRKNLSQTDIPHKGAYVYKGPNQGESYVKTYYFTNRNTIYEIDMNVGGGLPLSPTPDGEVLLEKILKSIEFE